MSNFKLCPSEALLLGMVLEEFVATREYAVDVSERRRRGGGAYPDIALHERRFLEFATDRLKPYYPEAYTVRFIATPERPTPQDVKWHVAGDLSTGISSSCPNYIFREGSGAVFVELHSHLPTVLATIVRDCVAQCPYDAVKFPLDAPSWLQHWIKSQVTLAEGNDESWLAWFEVSGNDDLPRIQSRLTRYAEQHECLAEFTVGRHLGRLLGAFYSEHYVIYEFPCYPFFGP